MTLTGVRYGTQCLYFEYDKCFSIRYNTTNTNYVKIIRSYKSAKLSRTNVHGIN